MPDQASKTKVAIKTPRMMFRMACVLVAVSVEGGEAVARVALTVLLAPCFLYVCGFMIICTIALSCGGDIDYSDEAQTPRARPVIRTRPADAQECPICLVHAEAPVALACGHAFHAACVTRWLDTRATCPMCRSKQLA